jgi:hypothetical protein
MEEMLKLFGGKYVERGISFSWNGDLKKRK